MIRLIRKNAFLNFKMVKGRRQKILKMYNKYFKLCTFSTNCVNKYKTNFFVVDYRQRGKGIIYYLLFNSMTLFPFRSKAFNGIFMIKSYYSMIK